MEHKLVYRTIIPLLSVICFYHRVKNEKYVSYVLVIDTALYTILPVLVTLSSSQSIMPFNFLSFNFIQGFLFLLQSGY